MHDSTDSSNRYARRTLLCGLAATGGISGISLLDTVSSGASGRARAQETLQNPTTTITASPTTAGAESAIYTVTIENIAARGGLSSVDQVVLNLAGTGVSFDSVQRTQVVAVRNPQTDATPLVVTQTRTRLAGQQPTIGISRASGQPRVTEGDTLQVRISGVRNPPVAGLYNVAVSLNELATGQQAGLLDSRTAQLTIGPVAAASPVVATVTDDDGAPITAPITVTDGDDTVLGAVTPDETGEFVLEDVALETDELVVSVPGYEDAIVPDLEVVPGETTTVEIELEPDPEPADFVPEIDTVPEAVDPGEPVPVELSITNPGTEPATETITVEFVVADGDVLETVTESVSIEPGETEELTVDFETDGLDPGEYSVRVPTDTAATAEFVTVVVEEFVVEVTDADSPVVPGESGTVTTTVTNDGEVTETQHVQFVVDGELVDTERVTLEPGESTDVTFEWSPTGLDPGLYDAVVQVGDESDAVTLEVAEPPPFELEPVELPDTVAAAEVLEVAVRVENVGDVAGTQPVTLVVDGRPVDTTLLQLDSDASRLVHLHWPTEGIEPGSYGIDVATPTDTMSKDEDVGRAAVVRVRESKRANGKPADDRDGKRTDCEDS